jgi:hypothetical protein
VRGTRTHDCAPQTHAANHEIIGKKAKEATYVQSKQKYIENYNSVPELAKPDLSWVV